MCQNAATAWRSRRSIFTDAVLPFADTAAEPSSRSHNGVDVMVRVSSLGVVAAVLAALTVSAQQPRWFSAWAAAHNVGLVVLGLNGGSVRLIVRPTLSVQSLRVKLAAQRT